MTPTPQDIAGLIAAHRLGAALRGEVFVYTTPEAINDDMRPTDHAELLEKGLYPNVPLLGVDVVTDSLNEALAAICTDALGVFCAHQCFYIEIVKEQSNKSPLAIDRVNLPKILAQAFVRHGAALHQLEVRPGDVKLDRSYRVTLSGMRILGRDHGIDWGMVLPLA